jgi:hypothetical protein
MLEALIWDWMMLNAVISVPGKMYSFNTEHRNTYVMSKWCIQHIDIILKIDCLMAHTDCLVFLISTVIWRCKCTLWKASASGGHATKQSDQQGRRAGQEAGWQGSQGCLICFRPILCLLLVPLFCYSGCFTNKYVLSNLLFLDVYDSVPFAFILSPVNLKNFDFD